MSLRKKRLIMVVVGVIVCSVGIWFMGEYALNSDREEYARRCKYFEGAWRDKDKTLSVEIHRVTNGYLFFSIKNNKFGRDLELLRAYAVGDEVYEFSYATESGRTGRIYKIKPGSEGKGTIHLLDDKVKIDFPRIPNKSRGLEYTGVLTEKSELPSSGTHHLAEYLGTSKKMAGELSSYCSFYYDGDGKIWRVHAMVAENDRRYKTDIAGISMNSTEQECEESLGKLVWERQLGDTGSCRRYENDTCISTVMVNSFGVITELDCQLARLPGATREGDFFMKGNTLYRYTGDYSQQKTIELPERTKRIATHAFDAGEHGYSLSEKERKPSQISIASGILVEEDAFANCGPLKIYLKSGWKEIPKGAFAHTVSLESLSKKSGWVTIVLPPTIQKIGDRAFALGESEEALDTYWKDQGGMDIAAVSVQAAGFSTWKTSYIGEDAFWGISMGELPEALTYLGKNYTLSTGSAYIPASLTTLKQGSIYLLNAWRVYLEGAMKEIEDGALRGNISGFSLQLLDNSGDITEETESLYNWIVSKDKKIIYAITSSLNYNHDYDDIEDYYDAIDDYYDIEDYYEDIEDYYEDIEDDIGEINKNPHYQMDEDGELVLKIPEGVEEIRSYAGMGECGRIIIPKSVRRISTEAFLNSNWAEVTFLGDIPELYGDLSRCTDEEGYVNYKGKLRVKKGKKKKLLKELMRGREYPKEKKEQLSKCITTF